MFELINDVFKDHSQEQSHDDCSPSSVRPTASRPAALDETEEDRQAVLRWVDEGNPNCQE